MNGPRAELCAVTIKPPNTRRTNTIGIIHHIFRCQRKVSSSPAMPNRVRAPSMKRMKYLRFLRDQSACEQKPGKLAADETMAGGGPVTVSVIVKRLAVAGRAQDRRQREARHASR